MSKVVNDSYIIQLIKATEFEEFSHLARLHKNAKGDAKKPITDQIAQMYGDLVYYKYIAKPQQVIELPERWQNLQVEQQEAVKVNNNNMSIFNDNSN